MSQSRKRPRQPASFTHTREMSGNSVVLRDARPYAIPLILLANGTDNSEYLYAGCFYAPN